MIDQTHILVQAGNGGNGCESYFHRTDRKQVPDGGDGGNGGSIIFRVSKNAPPISRFQFSRHLVGESGGHGSSNRKRGKNGADMVVLVPEGTSLYDRQRNLSIREFMKEDEDVVVAQGGRGGYGNQGDKPATQGEKGAVVDLQISIHLMADVYLVGLPNSGKSAILKQLTRAQGKTEAYPFTTKSPELGVWKCSDYEHLVLCDLPSLYGGSHEGRGMGNQFLKHLEFARAVLYVLDPLSEFAGGLKEGYEILRDEIGCYNSKFLDLPSAVIINKIDLPGAQEKADQEKWRPQTTMIRMSARTGEGLDDLKKYLEQFIRQTT